MIVRRLLMPLSLFVLAAFAGPAVAQAAFPAPLPNGTTAPAPAFPPVNQAPAPAQKSAAPAQKSAGPAQGAPAAAPFPAVNAGQPPAPPPSAFPSPTATPGSQGMFSGGFAPPGAPPRASAEQEECLARFAPLRADVERRGKLIQAAGAKKASAQEACGLIKGYVAAEKKVVDYVTTKQTACGIPPEVPTSLKASHVRSQEMLKQVCGAAAAQAQGGGPAAPPSLSEVLGSTNLPTSTRQVRSGGSTFDTINGNVLSR